ncbi:MAG: DUF4382 domain-containing protein [Trueperaceae bacterium]|nr:DUF4382 domain-containing protein [Trueperaceae bacterium]
MTLLVGGCAGLNDDAVGTNRVTVLLTDAPATEATHLWVAFGRVDLVPAEGTGGGIVTVYDGEPVTYDVLALTNGTTEELGRAVDVPDGTYEQVRFIVQSATLSFCDGAEEPACEHFDVFVPSGAQTGIKVNVQPPLILAEGANQTLIVDFDVERAIVETPPGSGNYLLKPTALRAISEAGAIAGAVEDGDGSGLGGVRVEVYPAGSEHTLENLVVATSSEEDGSFAFIALIPGSYDLVVSLDGFEDVTVSDVSVAVGETTAVGPITLEAMPSD